MSGSGSIYTRTLTSQTLCSGNVLNGTIGKQMVDTLVESTANVEVSTKYNLYSSRGTPQRSIKSERLCKEAKQRKQNRNQYKNLFKYNPPFFKLSHKRILKSDKYFSVSDPFPQIQIIYYSQIWI